VDGVGQYPIAIIRLPDGSVKSVPVEFITFDTKCPVILPWESYNEEGWDKYAAFMLWLRARWVLNTLNGWKIVLPS